MKFESQTIKLKSKTVKFKKKKKGFTLIELVAVLAIIAILSAAFIPKIGDYITEAKKVSILNEAKTIVTAYESIKHKNGFDTDSIGSDFEGSNLPLESGTLKKLSDATVKQCIDILDTENNTFNFSDDGTSIIINADENNSITLN